MLNLQCSRGSISAAFVGGGVPSFSFGQSFARSSAVSITSASAMNNREGKTSKTNTARQGSQTTDGPKSNQTQNNRNVTDVVLLD